MQSDFIEQLQQWQQDPAGKRCATINFGEQFNRDAEFATIHESTTGITAIARNIKDLEFFDREIKNKIQERSKIC